MTTKAKAGQRVLKNGKAYGTVKEILDEGQSIIITLDKRAYSTSDMRDDAGIPTGTVMDEGIISPVQIFTGGTRRAFQIFDLA